MTIDEAIAHAREKADENSGCWKHCASIRDCKTCEQEHEQIAEWLEELKALRITVSELQCELQATGALAKERDEETRNEAIDDFAKLVEKWCWKHEQYNQDDLNELMEIAEQLKKGDGE